MELKTDDFIDIYERGNLEVGEKYTLVSLSDFGFPYALQFKLVHVDVIGYAQYPQALELTFRKKRARANRRMIFLPYQKLLIWKGWVDPDTDMWKGGTEKRDGMVVKRGLKSFDSRYIQIAKFSLNRLPDIEYYGN